MPRTPARKNSSSLEALAREKLGFEALRPGQKTALGAVLNGRDTLVVLPTGAGKSAIYQLAALLLEGPTIVISPLIALQHDQRQSIEQRRLAKVAALNSTLRD